MNGAAFDRFSRRARGSVATSSGIGSAIMSGSAWEIDPGGVDM